MKIDINLVVSSEFEGGRIDFGRSGVSTSMYLAMFHMEGSPCITLPRVGEVLAFGVASYFEGPDPVHAYIMVTSVEHWISQKKTVVDAQLLFVSDYMRVFGKPPEEVSDKEFYPIFESRMKIAQGHFVNSIYSQLLSFGFKFRGSSPSLIAVLK